jgi:tRNA(Ile2) C34 agmatinyltransferase TiaS
MTAKWNRLGDLIMFMNYQNPGICRRCNDIAYGANAFICTECAKIANRERMIKRYEENIQNGYTANGTERKRRFYKRLRK